MATGVYTELLPCGGKLQVMQDSWSIYYYFSGPDGRYNGTSVTIDSESINDYIRAFANNWNEYLSLKKTLPAGGDFEKSGEMHMTIRVGTYLKGVYLRGYNMPLEEEKDVQNVIDSYKYAVSRSIQIQKLLSTID